jgi:protein-disulfide isomerase
MTEPGPSPEQPPSPAPDGPARALWTYFLTPAALLVGSLIIAGTVWYTGRDEDDAGTAAAAEDGGLSQPPGSTPVPAGADLKAVFLGYATQVGVDSAAFGQCLTRPSNVDLLNAHLQRGQRLGVNGTPTFFINNKMVVGAQPAAVFDEVIDAELRGSPTSVDSYSETIRQLARDGRFAIVASPPDVSDATFEGERTAKVVVAEFSDFQCPFCRRWNNDVLTGLRERLGKDVALAFLHFPIQQIHPNAPNASVAAICAGEQGKFWEMHDLLFARQSEWEKLRAQ